MITYFWNRNITAHKMLLYVAIGSEVQQYVALFLYFISFGYLGNKNDIMATIEQQIYLKKGSLATNKGRKKSVNPTKTDA